MQFLSDQQFSVTSSDAKCFVRPANVQEMNASPLHVRTTLTDPEPCSRDPGL